MPLLTLETLDWVVVILAVLGAIYVGHRAKARRDGGSRDSAVDYILAGRSLTAPLFAATLIATWYGAVLGAGEFVARYGVVMILCFGVPYYLVALVYAFFLAHRIRQADAVSIPDQIRRTYGDRAGYVASILILVIAIPAPYMLTLGIVIDAVTQVGLPIGILLGSIIALSIVARGGLRSDVHANVLQVILMYVGFAVLAIGCVQAFGAPGTMWDALPSAHRSPSGDLGWAAVLAWFFIALQTFIDPNFHVRAAAAKTPRAARTGLIWSVIGWIMFDGLQVMIGLYAVAYVPISDPSETFLVVANTALPVVGKGLFVAAVLAAVMSTLDGYALVSATTIGHDLIDAVRGGGHRRSSLLVGLAVTGTVGVIVAIAVPSIVDLIFYAASIAVPALLLPMAWSLIRPLEHHRRSWLAQRSGRAEIWMTAPALVAVGTIVTNAMEVTALEPMFTGLAVSILLAPVMTKPHGDR